MAYRSLRQRAALLLRDTALDDAKPERRGINSIQLFKDPQLGWRIVAMIWDNKREGARLPAA